MPKSFNIWPLNNTGAVVRLVAVLLLAANLVAAYFVIRPIGGSPAELSQQLADLRTQQRQRQGSLERTKKLVQKIEAGRGEGNEFMDEYFLPRRTASSTILAELTKDAAESKIAPKESSYAFQPVEGSDDLSMMTISAGFECSYGDLIHFINLIDRSDNLLIIEALGATPLQGATKALSVTMKLDAFVREDGSGQ
jgi:hypothetical protein